MMTYRRTCLAAAAVGCLGLCAHAQNGTWTNNADGVWSGMGNWSGGIVADGAGNFADFSTIDITANRVVTLDSDRTIGSLLFGDTVGSSGWTISAPAATTLTLDNGMSLPSVTVNNGLFTVGSNVTLTGGNGLRKLGGGTMQLNTGQTWGDTVIQSGTLLLFQVSGSQPGGVGGTVTLDGGILDLRAGNNGSYSYSLPLVVASASELRSSSTANEPTFTWAGDISGMAALTLSYGRTGSTTNSSTLILSGDNTGFTGGFIVAPTPGGSGKRGVRFDNAGALGGPTNTITVNSGTMASLNYDASSSDLARFNLAADSVLGLSGTRNLDIDLSPTGLNANAFIGALGTATFTGTLTPFGSTYRFGPGNGILTISTANVLTGMRDVVVEHAPIAAGSPAPGRLEAGGLSLTADQDFVGTVTVRNSTSLSINSFARVNNNPVTLQSGGIFRPVGTPSSVITYSNGSIASAGGQIAPFGNTNVHGVRFDDTCSIELTSGTTSMGFGNQSNGRGIMYFDCVISGSGGLFLAQGNNNNVATRVFSNLNTFAGGLQLNSDGGGGNISIVLETDSNGMGAGPLGSGQLDLNSSGSSRIIASGGARSIDNALRHGAGGPFRLATDNVVGTPLPPAFTGHNLSISGPVTLVGATAVDTVRRFEVQGSLTLTLSGPVSVSSNTAGIRKEETGTLVITNATLGANGNYEVNGGTLLLNTGATTNSAVRPVSVVSGATFGGTAIVDRNLIMSSGARLHPGGLTTPGTLTFGRNVNLGGPASVVRYRLGSASDTITLASQDSMPVSVDLASAAIEIVDGPGFAPALYTLLSSVHASQTFSGTFGTLSGIPMGFTATVLYPGDAIPASLGGGTVADGSVLLAVESTGPSVTLTSPVGAETWEVYDAQSVTWTNGGGFSDNVDILLSLDGGATYPITLGSNVANTGSFTVPAATLAYAGLSARVRVEATMGGSPASASSANFRILADIEGGNSNVNLADLALLLAQFGGPSASPPADLNGDGNVNAADLNLLLEQFGL